MGHEDTKAPSQRRGRRASIRHDLTRKVKERTAGFASRTPVLPLRALVSSWLNCLFQVEVRFEPKAAGLGWAIWDWSAGFRYWDQKKGEPLPGMREALFGKQ